MTDYYIDVSMPKFTVTRNRHTGYPDDVYLYWKVQVRNIGFGIDNKPYPPTEVQTAKLHIPGIPILATNSMAPDLHTIQEQFFDDQNNPFKQPLKTRVKAKEGQAVLVYYLAESILTDLADPGKRSRAFNNTVDEVEEGVKIAEAVGSITPAGPYIAVAGEAIKIGLDMAKGINNFLDSPDQPQVNCSGPLASEYVGVEVSDLVQMLGAQAEITHSISKESYQQTPAACSAHGTLSSADLTFTIKPVPEFINDPDPDHEPWREEPVTGMPFSAWEGTWGETPRTHSNKIECTIQVRPPEFGFIHPSLDIQIRERLGTYHYLFNLRQRIYHTTVARVGATPIGQGQVLFQSADSINLHEGIRLFLYVARDRFNNLREYRIKYQRRNEAGVLQEEKMLVHAYHIM